jgi:putative transposase
VLSVVDAYTRECLALEVDTSFASHRVTRVLEAIVAERGQPKAIRCDNGPELTSRHFLALCVERQIELIHIQPGKPTQNPHVESFAWTLTGRVLSGKLVSEFIRCTTENLGVADRVQRGASAQQLGIQDTEGVCYVAEGG